MRKTCISRMMDAEVLVNCVAQLSRQKNLKSVGAYKAASTVHQGKLSNILSRSTPKSSQSDNQGRTLGGGVGGCDTPLSLAKNCKKSVQNSFKIAEKVGPISWSRDM